MVKFVRNRFKIPVVVGCISCAHKDYITPKRRKCTLDDRPVGPRCVCNKWKMSPCFVDVGAKMGRIKNIDYLRYVQDIREQEAIREEAGEKFCPMSLEEIEENWKKEHGSIFV